MKGQKTLDSEDLVHQLCNYLIIYSNVLTPIQISRIANCIRALID